MVRLFAAALITSLIVPTVALAQDDGDDKGGDEKKETTVTSRESLQRVDDRAPREGTPLISNKLYPMQFRFELTGIFDYGRQRRARVPPV